jgi:non-specific serine/threonine protein kinase
VREIEERLTAGRLVTLVGPGGIGKTRLALAVAGEAAETWADGAAFVDLSGVTDGALMPGAVATALGLEESPRDGGSPAPGRELPPRAGSASLAALEEYLRPRRLLLILDNCEHLPAPDRRSLAAARLSADLLARCPGLRVLATSRERLGVTGEVVFAVPPLDLAAHPSCSSSSSSSSSDAELPRTTTRTRTSTRGPDPALAPDSPAVQLFVERARAVRSGFGLTPAERPFVEEICRRLVGIPLAIELAAALVEALSPAEIAARLEDRFDLLAGGDPSRPARHQSLEAVIDWSYDLLSEPERALLRRLSVFAGGWTLGAAEAVGGQEWENGRMGEWARRSEAPTLPLSLSPIPPVTVLPLLRSLVARSLVGVTPAPAAAGVVGAAVPRTRYRMLETVREYARRRLEAAGEAEAARRAHFEHCLGLAERAEGELTGPHQVAWLGRLDEEEENLRAALEASLSEGRRQKAGGRRQEAGDDDPGRHLPPAFCLLPSEAPLRLAAALGRYWQIRGRFREGRAFLERALAGSAAGSTGKLVNWPIPDQLTYSPIDQLTSPVRAKGLGWAAFLALLQGEHGAARRLGEESLALWRRLEEPAGIAAALGTLGILAKNRGQREEAAALLGESLCCWREVGDTTGISSTLGYLGILAAEEGDAGAARELYEESLALRREAGDRWGIAASLNNLGGLAREQGDSAQARSLLEESLRLRRELGDRRCTAITLNVLGLLAMEEGDFPSARQAMQESLAIAWEIGDQRSVAYSLEAQARLAGAGGEWRRAARRAGAAGRVRETIEAPLPPPAREEWETFLAAGRSALGEEAFADAWRAGRAVRLEDLIGAVSASGASPAPERGAGPARW